MKYRYSYEMWRVGGKIPDLVVDEMARSNYWKSFVSFQARIWNNPQSYWDGYFES